MFYAKNPLPFLLLITTLAAQAQGKLTGVVLDSATRQPLAFASVFLANTTLGATTTEQGEFVFSKVPAGSYDIVGSYVGYNLSKQNITDGQGGRAQNIDADAERVGAYAGRGSGARQPAQSGRLRQVFGLFSGSDRLFAAVPHHQSEERGGVRQRLNAGAGGFGQELRGGGKRRAGLPPEILRHELPLQPRRPRRQLRWPAGV
ncbi:MAG: carboxypeptidase-like regulatory domain-containing protein [Hymenobacter sp.]